MKESVLWMFYIVFTLYCNVLFLLASVSGEDVDITQTVSTTVHMQKNVFETNTSEEEINPSLESNLVNSDELEPSINVDSNFRDKNNNLDNLNQQVFSEVVSQNSGVANDILNSGNPVVLTLSDPATTELQQRADIPSVTSQNDPTSSGSTTHQNKSQTGNLEVNNDSDTSTKDRSDKNLSAEETDRVVIDVPNVPKNSTTEEEIPSFSEWAQKRLEEAERKEQVNVSVQGQHSNGKQGSGAKLRWKNYASLDCGAKVIASNPESVSPWAVLSPSRDEYKLNTCTSRIWFIVELCEAIQAKKIDLANYELFSSSPKDFTVSVSDRYPSRDWSNVGQFSAKDERDIQSFDLHPPIFGKYIKVEIKSHYGSEHFCPISLFRVYGTSVFEVLQKEDPAHENRIEDDDDDEDALDLEKGDSPKNLFTSATDVVISMVKKAAEVLGNKQTNGTNPDINKSIKYTPLINTCTTPSYLVVCNNCSDTLFGQVYELLSCKSGLIKNLISIPFISNILMNSTSCKYFGFDFRNKSANYCDKTCYDCLESFFPPKFLGAMCNTMAILENKVVLNISQQFANITQNVTNDDRIVNIITPEPHIVKKETEPVQLEENLEGSTSIKPTEPLVLGKIESDNAKEDVINDMSVTSQIKPTKALTSDADQDQINTDSSTLPPEVNNIMPAETISVQVQETDKVLNNIPEQVSENMEPFHEPESIETVDDHLDHFISELSGDSTQTTPNSATTTTNTPHGQKESVFLRLSNRIKALERNMSLSSQYLEELSKRYKKQVDEMQRLLEKTISALNEENKKEDERNRQLEERLDNLTAAVEILLNEKNNWSSMCYWLVSTLLIICCVFIFCRRTTQKHAATSSNQIVAIHRRKSIDVVNHNPPTKKKRRPSDQALLHQYNSSQIEKQYVKDKRKRKKNRVLRRSNSINTLSEENGSSSDLIFRPFNRILDVNSQKDSDWVEGQNNFIEDVPFALDESEHSTLEPLPLSTDIKIDAPDFIQTASNVRLNRTVSHIGPIRSNGNSKETTRKSASLDESMRQENLVHENGTSSTEDNFTPKKERFKLKKLFNKVYRNIDKTEK